MNIMHLKHPNQHLFIIHIVQQVLAPKPSTMQHELSRIGALVGPIIAALTKYRNSGKITESKYNKYLKEVHAIFAKYNTDPRYSFLSEYDLLKHCMTEVDIYLFKNEPRVFISPRKNSQRWEEQQNVQHDIYEEDIEMSEPTPGASSSTSIPIIPSASQSTSQLVPYTPQQYELTTTRGELTKLFESKIEQHIADSQLTEEEARSLLTQLKIQ